MFIQCAKERKREIEYWEKSGGSLTAEDAESAEEFWGRRMVDVPAIFFSVAQRLCENMPCGNNAPGA